MKLLIYKTKEMENKLIVKRYKIPEDLLMDILRILFGNNIKHKIIGIQERQNIVLLNVNFDLTSLKNREAKENMEGILTDYSEYMKGLLGDTVLMLDEEVSGTTFEVSVAGAVVSTAFTPLGFFKIPYGIATQYPKTRRMGDITVGTNTSTEF